MILLQSYLMIMLGGAAGALSRYVAVNAILSRFGGRFPLGTFVVNVSGCFAIGVAMTVLARRGNAHPGWRLLIVTGFLGGYTTFSSFSYENFALARQGSLAAALLNAGGSVIAGYGAVLLGVLLAEFVLKQNT